MKGKAEHTILVCGSLALDEIFTYQKTVRSHLPASAGSPLYLNLRASGPVRTFGGCGGNVAYTLGLMGAAVRLHAWVGRDGDTYLAHLEESGVDISGILVAEGLSTPTGVLLADSVGDQILFFGEPAEPPRLQVPDTSSVALCVITAGTPSLTVQACRAAHNNKTSVVVDPGKFIMDVSAEELQECLEGADSIVFNEYELNLILDRLKLSEKKLAGLAGNLVITGGGAGITVLHGAHRCRIPAVQPDRILDPNGAGDAFLAGFSYGRARGYPPAESACLGATAASFNIETTGAQSHRFTMKAFRERYTKNYGGLKNPQAPSAKGGFVTRE